MSEQSNTASAESPRGQSRQFGRWGSTALRLVAPLAALAVIILVFTFAEGVKQYSVQLEKEEQPLGILSFAGRFLSDSDYTYGRRFLTPRNFQSIYAGTATVAVAALGMTIIIIAGGIDLSAGTALMLSAMVLAYCLRDLAGFLELPTDSPHAAVMLIGVAACVITGVLTGFINGALISLLRVVPFIVTLGTMSVFLGLGYWLGNNQPITPDPRRETPAWISNLLRPVRDPEWWSMPAGVWILIVLSILLAIILHRTVFGRYVFALGSNESTARLCGINVPWVKVGIYTLAGVFVGVAGLMQFANVKQANPSEGRGMELAIIAAVVIGGGSLSGGRGSVLGTLVGALIVQVISNGCQMLQVNVSTLHILLGLIIIAAVWFDQFRQNRLERFG